MTVQFDVFANPIAAARGAYPYLVVLQSDFAQGAREQIVAPLIPRERMAKSGGPLTPTVRLESAEYIVLVPALAGIRRRDLGREICSLAASRDLLLGAIDYLFFGV
jgi:toxin CcdB